MRSALALAILLLGPVPARLASQQPTPDQARAILQQRPDLIARIQEWLGQSGLSREQVRQRLAAAGYAPSLLDPYFPGANLDSLRALPDSRLLGAVRALGIVGTDEATLLAPDSVPGRPGDPRTDLDRPGREEPEIFGLDVFRRVSSQFQPAAAGPVDASYRLGPGDVLVLILTGDVELAHTLEVTREGFVVVPQVGQLYVSGLTLSQLDDVLYPRLGRVYSGVRRGAGATTRFQVTVARLRTNQVFVIGEVARPGSYQVSSAGTVLTALYLAGGPTRTGSFRRVAIRRGGRLVDSLDLYDYLLRGDNTHDIRLETGDVVFVPIRRTPVEITGAVARPAIYELTDRETLADLVRAAGGFLPDALRRRIQIDRILPPAERPPGGRDRVILEIAAEQVGGEVPPGVALQPGDRVRVFSVAEPRRSAVIVRGNVWNPGRVGYTAGMRVSDAVRLAGGPKPDVFLGQILVSRLNPDSTRTQLRAAFRDSSGTVVGDFALRDDDEIVVFSRTTFRPDRHVSITGAVKRPGRVPFRDGMTLRDAILEADGITEDALLTEAEVARMPADRSGGTLATTIRAPLDSTYLFDRAPGGGYRGPPGLPAPAAGAAEFPLLPYDNILILRQPDWELHRTVTIAGQVRYPGSYALRNRTERLTDLIARAGGLTREAYPRGAELHRRIADGAESGITVAGRVEARRARDTTVTGSSRAEVDTLTLGTDLAGRVGIDLARAIEQPASAANLILTAGDSLFVPEFTATIRVLGAVNAPTTVIHRPGMNLDGYVAAAGGYSRQGDRARAYVIQPGGQLESVKRRFLLADGNPKPLPGAVVVVPERDPDDRRDWAGLLGSVAQILASTIAIVVVATR